MLDLVKSFPDSPSPNEIARGSGCGRTMLAAVALRCAPAPVRCNRMAADHGFTMASRARPAPQGRKSMHVLMGNITKHVTMVKRRRWGTQYQAAQMSLSPHRSTSILCSFPAQYLGASHTSSFPFPESGAWTVLLLGACDPPAVEHGQVTCTRLRRPCNVWASPVRCLERDPRARCYGIRLWTWLRLCTPA